MQRRFGLLLALFVVVLAIAGPAAAHHLTVTPKGNGQGTTHWVGGPFFGLPSQAQGVGLFPGFFGPIPAAHGTGLVQACLMAAQSGVVNFIPPPPGATDTDCMHGE